MNQLIKSVYIIFIRIMNEFISPHQNININISYNLGQQQKIPKVVFGKKIAKIVKSTIKQQPKIFLKTFKKGQEQNPPSEQTKKFKPSKNKTKRKSNNLLTFPDQEDVVPRRLKTQGNSKSQITNSQVRKQPKNQSKSIYRPPNQHSKSVNNPPSNINKTAQNTKKQASQILVQKPKKQQRRVSNKSCILYQQKKHVILSDIEHHIASTSFGGIAHPSVTNKSATKKRVNSTNVIRSEKFINRLLDMSVLTSQLGNSIPIKDQNNKNSQNTNNRIKSALQGFMNSIDLRIIKKMQQDNKTKKNIIVDFDLGSGMDLIQFLNKIRRIPLQKLNQKATIIQRFWRKKVGQSFIPYYSNIFFRNPAINKKFAIQTNINQISQINIIQGSQEEQENQVIGLPVYSIKRNKNPKVETIQYTSGAKKNSSQKSSFQQESISAAKVKRVLDHHQQVSIIGEELSIQQNQRNRQKLPFVQQYSDSQKQQSQSYREFKANKKRKRVGIYRNIQDQQDQQLHFQFQEDKQQQNKNGSSLNIQKYKQLVKQSILQNQKASKGIGNQKNTQIRPNFIQRQSKVIQNPDKKPTTGVLMEQLKYRAHQGHNSPNLILQQEKIKKDNKKQAANGQVRAQSAHWNHVHNMLSSNINKKVPLMPKAVLQQLMKQSAINKQWVQSQFSSQSRKISSKSSPRQKQRQISGLVAKLPNIQPQKKVSQQQTSLPIHNKREIYNFQNAKIQNLKQKQKQKQKRQENSEQQGSISSGYQQEDTQKEQYNWNKYSDISKIKKPQEFITKAKNPLSNKQELLQNNNKFVNNFLNGNVDIKVNNEDRLNTLQITEQIKRKSKNSSEEGSKDQLFYQKFQIPGLMPSGLNNNQILQEVIDEKDYKPSKNEINIQFLSQKDIALNKDQKWVRQQMVMQDGIVQKYLDCGLDYFGINLQRNSNPQNLSLQQLQQREVEQKQEHKATLQKQNYKYTQPKNPHNSETKQKDDDIFSNQASNPHQIDDDMQLVYVFNNQANNWNKHVDLEHAVKNSKRKDNANHLAIRENDQPADITSDNPLSNNSKGQSQGQVTHQVPVFEPSFNIPSQPTYTKQQMVIQEQINNKRKQKITQFIVTKLIEQFAHDVSVILRKSHTEQEYRSSNTHQRLYQQNNRSNVVASGANANNVNNALGIQTNFQSIREFITKIKQYILNQEQYCRKVIQNLKNNIGPTSMEILSYLRLEQSNQFPTEHQNENEEQSDNEEWLFVIPNDLFQLFNKKLIDEEETNRGKKFSNKFKLYSQFWHRSIFQCYNECLDFQRPYGITGAPYTWVVEPKLPKVIKYSQQKVKQILQSAQTRLFQLSCSSSGIIFDKPDSPYRQFNISEQDKVQMNEQKISRMLATQIIDDQYNWITYNDEITQLMVDISRKVEQILIFQLSTDIKKIMRRRKVMVHINQQKSISSAQMAENNSSEDDQYAVFVVEDLM